MEHYREDFSSFGSLLSQSQLRQEVTVDDPRPAEDAPVDVVAVEEVPTAKEKVKILDHRQYPSVEILVTEDNKFFLISSEDVALVRGTRLCSVGSGKIQEGGTGPLELTFPKGDKTWCELATSNSNEDASGRAGTLQLYCIGCCIVYESCTQNMFHWNNCWVIPV